VGTVMVIADSREGTGIVLASSFIPAGAAISRDDIVVARMVTDYPIAPLVAESVVGKHTAVDIAPGDIVATHMLDSSSELRQVVTVPVGISPATSLSSGSRVELWFVGNGALPAVLVASDAVVVATRRGNFGEGDVVDISIADRDQNRVLGALGADGMFVFTLGTPPR
jgi:hypothetical protein